MVSRLQVYGAAVDRADSLWAQVAAARVAAEAQVRRSPAATRGRRYNLQVTPERSGRLAGPSLRPPVPVEQERRARSNQNHGDKLGGAHAQDGPHIADLDALQHEAPGGVHDQVHQHQVAIFQVDALTAAQENERQEREEVPDGLVEEERLKALRNPRSRPPGTRAPLDGPGQVGGRPYSSRLMKLPQRPMAWPRIRPEAPISSQRGTLICAERAKMDDADKPADDGAVDGQAAVPQVQDTQQVVPVEGIPLVDDVVEARPDQATQDDDQDPVPDQVGLLASPLGLLCATNVPSMMTKAKMMPYQCTGHGPI